MRMRGSAIRSVRSKCQSQWKMPNFVSHRPKNSVEIDSVVMNLRMREKTRFRVDFWLTYQSIYPYIYLSRSTSGLHATFLNNLDALWLKRRTFATIGAFWGLNDTL